MQQRHFVTLGANLSGFPNNPGWVQKQATDSRWKSEWVEVWRAEGLAWRQSLKIERGGERWATRFEEAGKSGSESLGKLLFSSLSFPFNILVCQFVPPSTWRREQRAYTPQVISIYPFHTQLHNHTCFMTLPICPAVKFIWEIQI